MIVTQILFLLRLSSKFEEKNEIKNGKKEEIKSSKIYAYDDGSLKFVVACLLTSLQAVP